MNTFEGSSEGAYAKPCNACRKRKVKCNKNRPCANCSKAKQLCTYENYESLSSDAIVNVAPSAHDGDVHERLARLEAMMASMMNRDPDSSSPTNSLERVDDSVSRSYMPTPPSLQQVVTVVPLGNPVGHIYFQDGHSAYYDSDFWASLISEVPLFPSQDLCPLLKVNRSRI